MQNDNYGIVLPLNSAKEWRSLPHDQLSFLQALAEVTPVITLHHAQVSGLIAKMRTVCGYEHVLRRHGQDTH